MSTANTIAPHIRFLADDLLEGRAPGSRGERLATSYIAAQIRWRADYNVTLSADDAHADVSGWVTVENNTGTAFADARVKLMAGDPRVDPERITYSYGAEYYKLVRTSPPTNKFGLDPSRAVGDYRLYALPEPTTVNNNQVKQIELIKASQVPVLWKPRLKWLGWIASPMRMMVS